MNRGSRGEALIVVALLFVIGSTSGVTPGRASTATDPVAQDTARPAASRRPFTHQRHERLPCRGCHGSGETHGSILVRAPADCAACHHDPRRGMTCTSCHSPNDIPAERTVQLSLSLQVASTTRTRDVSFPHALHVARNAGLVCADCHGAEVRLPKNVQCGSCHTAHHDGRAECTSCHSLSKAAAGAHDARVHLTCASAACHAADKAPVPTLARSVCLLCHQERRDHEPEGSCAACHRIPDAGKRSP